jgi:hypothetical protein
MKIAYINKRFSKTSLAIIEYANDIIEEYASQGYTLTLRQLYYQFVARDLIANRQSEYKRLGSVIADARLAGMVDWNAIEDRGRNIHRPVTWENPPTIIDACAEQYKLDLWKDQNYRPEVWIEKEALLSIAQAACEPYRVPYFACKGYVSQSAMWDAGARRIRSYINAGQIPVVIHLGDHDPSGIDMTRDIFERLDLFIGDPIDIKRIALNFSQIEQYKPPPNPAKITDSRFNGYADKYGEESWELDALSPKVLVSLIQDEIFSLLDKEKWDILIEQEKHEKETLSAIADNYDLVIKAVSERG